MLNNDIKNKLWEQFRDLGEEALAMNHYELAKNTDTEDPNAWREFLLEQDVRNYIQTEIELVRTSEFNKMIQNVGDNSRSVGQAQLMAALDKLKKDANTKEGPVFIYTYVPLSAEQEKAENAQTVDEDPFWMRG
jgi:hypothetical protein